MDPLKIILFSALAMSSSIIFIKDLKIICTSTVGILQVGLFKVKFYLFNL